MCVQSAYTKLYIYMKRLKTCRNVVILFEKCTILNNLSFDILPTLVTLRSASPKHGFTIMNRLSMENRTEPITKDLDFQLQDPFLLYRNARCESFLLHWVVLFVQFGQVFKIVQCMSLCLFGISGSSDWHWLAWEMHF